MTGMKGTIGMEMTATTEGTIMEIMAECGIHVAQSPADIGKTMAEIMK